MIFGYGRQSRKRRERISESLDNQAEQLTKYGCTKIFQDQKSGRKDRDEFNKLLSMVRDGDVIVVTEISRLGRTTLQLIKLFDELVKQNIHFVALRQGIDTRNPMGKFLFHLSSVLAENEIVQTEERTGELVFRAKKAGRLGGRPKGLTDETRKTALAVRALYDLGHKTTSIRTTLNIGSNATIYKYLKLTEKSQPN